MNVRSFHPKFDEIVALDDKRSAERTHEDASAWNRKLLSRSIETLRNIVLEGVFKDGQGLASVVEMLRKNGYEVTVRIVAVHERFSVWGINRRYEKEKIVRGHGRYVPIQYHDDCYRKILDTVSLLEDNRLVDRLEIYNRNGECLYTNTVSGKEWAEPAGARIAIERGGVCVGSCRV